MMIKLANKSRNNRMFFDELIKVLAVEINIGSRELNGDLELASYRSRHDVQAEFVSTAERRSFDTPRQILREKTLDEIDRMLCEAADEGLEGCCDRIRISDFIRSRTDLTDCHLTALNEMQLTRFHRMVH